MAQIISLYKATSGLNTTVDPERLAFGRLQAEEAPGPGQCRQIVQFDLAAALHERLLAEQLGQFAKAAVIAPVEGRDFFMHDGPLPGFHSRHRRPAGSATGATVGIPSTSAPSLKVGPLPLSGIGRPVILTPDGTVPPTGRPIQVPIWKNS